MAAGSSGVRKSDDTHTKTERFTAVKRSVFIFSAAKKPAPAQRQLVTLSPIFALIAFLYFPTTRIMEGLPDFPRDVPDTARDGCQAASARANTV